MNANPVRDLRAWATCLLAAYCFAVSTARTADDVDLTAEQFLQLARNLPVTESWARLRGTMIHKTGPTGPQKRALSLNIHIQPRRIVSQLRIDNGAPIKIEHAGAYGALTVTSAGERDGKAELAAVGIEPEDLTLSFLHWDFQRERDGASVRGQACRVLELRKPESGDSVQAFIAKKFFFPLRVLWFRPGESSPARTVEFTGFRKVNEFWIVSECKIAGPMGRSIVKFPDVTVEEVTPDRPLPADLFVK